MSNQEAVKDVNVEIRLRNNRVLAAMKRRGIKSVAELTRLLGEFSQTYVGDLINMKTPARRPKDDDWLPLAHRLAEFFQCLPEDLFSDEQQRRKLRRNRIYAEMSFAEVQQLSHQESLRPRVELEYEAAEAKALLLKVFLSLTPREERIIRMRFGLNLPSEMTLEEIGISIGRTRDRVRQIEAKALRKIKHPSRLPMIVKGFCRGTLQHPALDDEIISAL